MGERPVLGACAEGNLAHDDWGAERLFGLVISGRDVGHSQEREEAVDVRDHDAAAECFGGLIVEGLSGEQDLAGSRLHILHFKLKAPSGL